MSTVSVTNTTTSLSGAELLTKAGTHTVTGPITFDRDPSAPFAVSANSAVVTNLDADKIDGLDSTALGRLASAGVWTAVQQFPAGTVGAPSVGVGDSDVGLYSSGTNALDFTTNGTKALGIDATQFIDSPTQPRARAFNNATQSINDSTVTVVTLNSEDFDVGTCHDTGSNTSRLTIPTGGDGLYLIIAKAVFAANATGQRNLRILKNGSAIGTQTVATPAAGFSINLVNSIVDAGAAGDYYEMAVFQNSTGALNVGSATRVDSCELMFVKLW